MSSPIGATHSLEQQQLVSKEVFQRATIKIRKAVPQDLPRLIEIARHAATAAHWNMAQYERIFLSERLALVIEDGGCVEGFIAGRGVAEEWEIENVAVTGLARRRGLGSR